MKTIEILGVPYKVRHSNPEKDPALEKCDGFHDGTTKECVIDTFRRLPGSVGDLDEYRKFVTRHELIHAFLFESGLANESWAANEEIVDWIALQFPKMLQAFAEANAI